MTDRDRKTEWEQVDSCLAYNTNRKLGTGTMATVFKGKYKEPVEKQANDIDNVFGVVESQPRIGGESGGIDVAVKIYDLSEYSEEQRKNLETEIGILKRLKGHPNIVTLHYSTVEGDYMYIALGYVSGGDLYTIIESQKKIYQEDRAKAIAWDICRALAFCQKNGVKLRDIKPHNFIIDDTGKLLLSDFGLSSTSKYAKNAREYFFWHNTRQMMNCTPAYIDPLVDEGMVEKASLWSVGVMLFELVTGRLPFGSVGTAGQFEQYLRNASDAVYEFTEHEDHRLGQQFKDLVAKIFVADYGARMGLPELCATTFVQSHKDYWELVEERQKEYDIRVKQYSEYSQMKYQLKCAETNLRMVERQMRDIDDKNKLEMQRLNEQLKILVFELEEQTKFGKQTRMALDASMVDQEQSIKQINNFKHDAADYQYRNRQQHDDIMDLSQENKKMKYILACHTPSFSMPVFQEKLTSEAYKKRFKMNNFFYYDEKFEDNIGKVEQKPTYTYPDGSVYLGEWQKDQKVRQGHGSFIFANGAVYEGYWCDDKAQQNGRKVYADGSAYEGDWVDNQRKGEGIMYKVNGDRYEGQFDADVEAGTGVYFWEDGGHFEGGWQSGKIHGRGIRSWPDGTYYEGEYKNGQHEGHGIKTFSSGNKYDGNWSHGMKNGKGVFTWVSGTRYAGQYVNDKQQGFGIKTWSSGDRYEGEWHEDQHEGHGIYFWPDKSMYQGQWKNGIRHGHGTFSDKEGKIHQEQWEKGVKVIIQNDE